MNASLASESCGDLTKLAAIFEQGAAGVAKDEVKAPELVNESETRGAEVYCSSITFLALSSGGLIHTSAGSVSVTGDPLTNRSGLAA